VIIKLCEGHAVYQRLLSKSIDDIRDLIGEAPVCDCVIVLDRE
jgi:hypothetical protein